MKMKMRPRYYCDHCNKASGNPSFMKKHEAGCTLNPQRVCGMCAKVELQQIPKSKLVEAFEQDGFNAMVELANKCPACILSVLRMYNEQDESGQMIPSGPDDGRKQWSYADAKREWWEEYNNDEYEKYVY